MAVLRCRALLAVVLALAPASGLSPPRVTEDRIKGAFLGRFPSFVSWPDDASNAVFTIGVIGDRDLIDLFERVVPADQIRGRPLLFRSLSGPRDGARCQMVYLSAREARLIEPTLNALKGLPVLTVSDAPDFLRRGGMIHVFLEGSHVRFDINPRAMERAHLRVSSRLLALARPCNGGQE